MSTDLWILVSWHDGQPILYSFTDEHDAIEKLKEVKPYAHKVTLYVTDETGRMTKLDPHIW